MNTEVFEINEDGFIIGIYLNDGISVIPDGCITTPLPQPNFHRSKWTGTKWVEGMTQEEVDELTKPEESPLTDIEVLSQLLTERELELMLQGQQLVAFELKFAELEAKLNV